MDSKQASILHTLLDAAYNIHSRSKALKEIAERASSETDFERSINDRKTLLVSLRDEANETIHWLESALSSGTS